jgi:hypothetical protein
MPTAAGVAAGIGTPCTPPMCMCMGDGAAICIGMGIIMDMGIIMVMPPGIEPDGAMVIHVIGGADPPPPCGANAMGPKPAAACGEYAIAAATPAF